MYEEFRYKKHALAESGSTVKEATNVMLPAGDLQYLAVFFSLLMIHAPRLNHGVHSSNIQASELQTILSPAIRNLSGEFSRWISQWK